MSDQPAGHGDPRFSHSSYTIRKKVLKLVGGAFHIYDPAGNVVLYSQQKGFKLKEDIRLFGSEQMTEELLRIGARRAIDVSAVYDVFDSRTGQRIGALQRKGLKSLIADEWHILGDNDEVVGRITEDSTALALVRRLLLNLIPQTFNVELRGQQVAEFKQLFNPFVQRLTLDFGRDPGGTFDRRLGLAAGVLLSAIEGRQQ